MRSRLRTKTHTLLGLLCLLGNACGNDEGGVQKAISWLRGRNMMNVKATIPQIVWIPSSYNIFMSQEPADLYNNVLNIANVYRNVWDSPNAPVNFVFPAFCSQVLRRVFPDIVPHFQKELDQSIRDDICRAAVLYDMGGYWFDKDAQVVNAYLPPSDKTTFVATNGCDGTCYLPTFVASKRKHPIWKLVLENILDSYKAKEDMTLIGPYSMAAASIGLSKADLQDMNILEEDRLKESQSHPELERQVGMGECNIVIHSAEAEQVYFFTHYVGSNKCVAYQDAKIPHKLWFTYGKRVLETHEPKAEFENVERTIQKYREAWVNPDAETKSLDDEICKKNIEEAAPGLLQNFLTEPDVSAKEDICAVASVYLHGGYYIDIDMQVVEPYRPSNTAAFVGSLACNGGCFFRSFFGAAPKHPLLRRALDKMIDEYQKNQDATMLGSLSMADAYHSAPEEELAEIELLEELQLDPGPHPKHYPHVARLHGASNCNYVIHNEDREEIYFFARFIGYGGCQWLMDVDEEEDGTM